MREQILAGIDIGSSKIATIVGIISEDSGEIRVIGFNISPSRGVKKGLITDIEQVTAAVEESVEKAERMAGHKINQAFVSVGGPHISSLNSHGIVAVSTQNHEITHEDVDRVIDAARAISLSTTRQIIEVSPREYSVDGQSGINNPVGMSGVRLEVDTHIITASTTNLKNIDRCLEDLGIANAGYIFSGVASSEAVLTDTEKDLGVVVVDIGGGKIDMCIYVEGALSYSASIPIGAKHITNDIAVGLRVSLESAEKIKLYLSKHAKAIQESLKKRNPEHKFTLDQLNLPEQVSDVTPKTILSGIIAPRLEEIFSFIGEEIDRSNFGKQIPSGLVITGGGAQTIGMIEMGRKILGLPIRIGISNKLTGLTDEVTDPQFATTGGLIFYGGKYSYGDGAGEKDFKQVLKGVSLGGSIGKLKDFLKQFLP
ncbi:MAG: cell division protein FtsA [Patescibacteria group bacterium]|nr:cell division protein FtsA [Patescibacteria group bacterium]